MSGKGTSQPLKALHFHATETKRKAKTLIVVMLYETDSLIGKLKSVTYRMKNPTARIVIIAI